MIDIKELNERFEYLMERENWITFNGDLVKSKLYVDAEFRTDPLVFHIKVSIQGFENDFHSRRNVPSYIIGEPKEVLDFLGVVVFDLVEYIKTTKKAHHKPKLD